MRERKSRAWSARTWSGNWKLTTICALLPAVYGILANSPAIAADRYEIAALPPALAEANETRLPQILGAADVARYRDITVLQDEGRWAAADAAIATLDDRLLLGHVLAQRYLSRSYKTRFDELAAWLAQYSDEPRVHAIHA